MCTLPARIIFRISYYPSIIIDYSLINSVWWKNDQVFIYCYLNLKPFFWIFKNLSMFFNSDCLNKNLQVFFNSRFF